MNKITKAILPVAGFGTRFLPATKAQPKEMLPIYDTPAIEYIVREAVAAGITDIIMVTGRGKRAIEDHFDRNAELEYMLESKGKFEALETIRQITGLANFIYVRQPEPRGDGHALLCAERLIGEDESVVVLFGDDVVDTGNQPNAVEQLISVYEQTLAPVMMLEEVPLSRISQYGVAEIAMKNSGWGEITKLVEKPKPEAAPSNLGVIGKYIITPSVWKDLKKTSVASSGEIRLADALIQHIARGDKVCGRILDGLRFDTGDKNGFLEATLHYARKNGGAEIV